MIVLSCPWVMVFYGGRWNSKGVAAVYASDSIVLAALENWFIFIAMMC